MEMVPNDDSNHHILYEIAMAVGLSLDSYGKLRIEKESVWFRCAAIQEAAMTHIRAVFETFLINKNDQDLRRDFHVTDLIEKPEWETFIKKHTNTASGWFNRDDRQKIENSWKEVSVRVSHIGRDRDKGHEVGPMDLRSAITFLLPFIDRYLGEVEACLQSRGVELKTCTFEKWYSHIRHDDSHNALLLNVCQDVVTRFRAS